MEDWSIVVSIISVSLAVLSGLVSIFQWRGSQTIERANKINDLLGSIGSDDCIRSILHKIDYEDGWYTDEFHNGKQNDLERQVDRTFSYFSYICYLRQRRILTKEEFRFFEYSLRRIFDNSSSVDYLYNIWHFSKKRKTVCPFLHLCRYGLSKRYLSPDFKDPKAYSNPINTKYHKRLNI